MIFYTHLDCPLGSLLLTSDGGALTGLHLPPNDDEAIEHDWIRDAKVPPFPEAVRQLRAYFDGSLTQFDLPLLPMGTAFQRRVWNELEKIPYGVTISYGELAHRVGNPKASRAVGLANGRNPIPIIVPCHRVIGASGKLVGYGGGLDAKRVLLDLESSVASQQIAMTLRY